MASVALGLFWPSLGRQARQKRAEWQVKAAGVQVANGTAPADLDTRLGQLKDQAPHLAPAIREVEAAQAVTRHDERWKTVQAEALSLAALDDPAAPLSTIDAFLREYPETPRRADALALARSLKDELAKRRTAVERRFVDDLITSESLPTVSLTDQIERARQFLAEHPESAVREEVNSRLEMYLKRLDEHDIDQARDFSRKNPTQFASRIERFRILENHEAGGRFVSEAIEAKDHILREWDYYAYRQAYDHCAGSSRRCRRRSPSGCATICATTPMADYAAEAQHYQDWWDKVSVPGQYRVTLRRGEVEPKVGKYFAGGAPTWASSIEVAGAVYGPSTIIRDSHRPVWDYTFPQPITWKLGDPVTVRIIDYDWSASEVYVLHSRQGDPLAMRLLVRHDHTHQGGQDHPRLRVGFRDADSESARMRIWFEQAVYGSFPFWNRGYGVLAHSPGCRPEWLAELRQRLPALRRASRGAPQSGGFFALPLQSGPWLIAGVHSQGCDDLGRPGALAFHALFVGRWAYCWPAADPFAFEHQIRGDWCEDDQHRPCHGAN